MAKLRRMGPGASADLPARRHPVRCGAIRGLLLAVLCTGPGIGAEQIDAVLACDWEGLSGERLDQTLTQCLMASAEVVSGRADNVDHPAVGQQCVRMVQALVREAKQRDVQDGISSAAVVCCNIAAVANRPNVLLAFDGLMPLVSVSSPRAFENALFAARRLEATSREAVAAQAPRWIRECTKPAELDNLSATFGAPVQAQVWERLLSSDFQPWVRDSFRLASSLVPTPAAQRHVFGQALQQVASCAADAPLDRLPYAGLVLRRQGDYRQMALFAGDPAWDACLARARLPMLDRLACWLALSLPREAHERVLGPLMQRNIAAWAGAEWPARGGAEQPADRMHDLLLAAMTPMAADRAQRDAVHEAVRRAAVAPFAPDATASKILAGRAALWSLAWRSAPDPAAFVRAHSALVKESTERSSPTLWLLSSNPYGSTYLFATDRPRPRLEPEAALLARIQRGEVSFAADRDALTTLLVRHPHLPEAMRAAEVLWHGDAERRPVILGNLVSSLRSGPPTEAQRQFAETCLLPEVAAIDAKRPESAQLILAVSLLLRTPAAVEAVAARCDQTADPGWSPVLDALLRMQPRHPRVALAIESYRRDAHPASPVFVWLAESLRGDAADFPAEAWSCILSHPHCAALMRTLPFHAAALSRVPDAMLRDPRCLLGASGLGLGIQGRDERLDEALRLLGCLDLIEACRLQAQPEPRPTYAAAKP